MGRRCSSWFVASYAGCVAVGYSDRRALALRHSHYRQVYCSSVAPPRAFPPQGAQPGWSHRANPPLLNGKNLTMCGCVCVCFLGGRAMHSSNQMADSAPRGFVGHRVAALLLGAVVERPSAHHFQHNSGRLITCQGCGQIEKMEERWSLDAMDDRCCAHLAPALPTAT